MAASSTVISAVSSPASVRSEATFPASGWPSAKPSRRAPDRHGRPVRAVLPRSAGRPVPAKKEAARGHRGQLARRITCRAIRAATCQPARLMTAIDLRSTPELPAIDLP
jgi:hypothetical protein